MNGIRAMTAAGLIAGLCVGVAQADEYELAGTLRDFSDSHSDFQNTYNGEYPLIQGMVKNKLGEAGKPVLNIGQVGCRKIYVESRKDISNVVLEFSDGSRHKCFDDLDQQGVDNDHMFELPDHHPGVTIVGAWVKAGRNFSGDGPGYGEYFDGGGELTKTHDVVNDRRTITVTFICEDSIPDQWRIESEETFNQWYRNTDGVNYSVRHSIVLSNGRDEPGGMYRFEASKHNGRSFFPMDGRLRGNEGRHHNYHFTYEIATTFRYIDPVERANDDDPSNDELVLTFSGDDDVWVFVNGRLVVDIGGVHGEKWGQVNLDEVADEIGLAPGETYDFNFFFAERHTSESNFTLETNFPFLPSQYD